MFTQTQPLLTFQLAFRGVKICPLRTEQFAGIIQYSAMHILVLVLPISLGHYTHY